MTITIIAGIKDFRFNVIPMGNLKCTTCAFIFMKHHNILENLLVNFVIDVAL